MIKKCIGCGVELQDNNVLLEGYTHDLTNDICRRCFRLKNYGEYEFITKSNEEYIKLLRNIGNKPALVLYIVDLLNIPNNIEQIKTYLVKNDVILVLNKKDTLPLSLNEEKILDYFRNKKLPYIDMIIVSAEKNYHLDELMNLIKKYKTTQDVYVVGNTNAGKSTLINKIITNYTIDNEESLTISPMPSTTLDEIKIKINDFYLVDTPGLVDDGNILNYVKEDKYKIISVKKEIKPKTYQLKKGQSLIIDDLFRIDYVEGEKNSFTLFISNNLPVKRIYSKKNTFLKDNIEKEINLRFNEDIVINGLGFIKTTMYGQIKYYANPGIEVFVRKSLI